MSDLFEREEQQNFFQSRLPERPEDYRPGIPITPGSGLPETPEEYRPATSTRKGMSDDEAAGLIGRWNEEVQQRTNFRRDMISGSGIELSPHEFNVLYNMRKNGIIDDDDIYRLAFSREIGGYLGINTAFVLNNYDEIWQMVSGDMENRYALPKSRWEAIKDSIQIARNMNPLGRMGNELEDLHGQLRTLGSAGIREDKVNEFLNMDPKSLRLGEAWDNLTEAEKQYVNLRRRADSLWGEITNIQRANEELSRRMPRDALTTIATSTIQSAPLTGKSVLAGLAGGVVAGAIGAGIGALGGGVGAGPGFAGGFRIGYGLGSFAASSSEMAGLMYVDLLAAGVEQENAARLALLGGSINGFIESWLGIVAGVGGSAAKAIGGRIISQEVRERIAEAASKNFIKRMMTSGAAASIGRNVAFKTATDMGINALGEGLEEALQYMVEQGMLALGDAMQDAPVDRNAFMDEQYRSELYNSILGGLAGGLGFGIAGLPLTITGNVSDTARQTTELKKLAITIDNEAEFRKAAHENPLTRNLSDEQINQIFESQEGERQAQRREEAARTEELRNRRLYGAMDKSGDIYRGEDESLYMEHSRHTESGGLVTFEFAAGNPHGGEQNSYAIGRGELRGDVPVITELRIGEKYEGLRGEILQNVANDIGKPFEYGGQQYAPNGEGRSLRYGWGTERAAQNAGRGFNIDRPYNSTPDSQADIAAKQNFAEKLSKLNTQLSNKNEINTVVDFYDTVGRKWFGMGFDAFMNRLTGGRQESLLTQELSDAEVARWVAKNEGLAADAAAVRRIQENLTDAQREEARQNIHGFIVPGADGVTKAIYAALDADMSTFIHEGLHAFTLLAKALDPDLYRQMMEAAGFSQEEYARADAEGRERMTRQAMETLAYGAEAYLKEGPKSVHNSKLKNLYERIKEFLKDLAYAAQKGEYLTPEVRALFDGLFGEQAEGAKTEQEGQEAAATRTTTEMSPEGRQEAATAPEEEFALYSDNFDRIIKDESRTIEERSEAVIRKAGREYSDALLDKQDRGHRPTAELIKRAMRITDAAERAKIITEIRELRKRYEGTAAEFKAPNGKASRLIDALGKELGQQAWYAVRTEGFKEWFGDWEVAANAEWVFNASSVKQLYGSEFSKSETDLITQVDEFFKSIGGKVEREGLGIIDLTKRGAKNSIAHGIGRSKAAAFTAVPDVIKHGKIIDYQANWKGRGYNTYVIDAPITIRNVDYIAEVIINQDKDGQRFYLHELEIKEKAQSAFKTGMNTGAPQASKLIITRKLNEVNGNVSKIVDENGEPSPLWHQTGADIETFDPRRGGAGQFDNETPFGIFLKPHDRDIGLAGKKQMQLYANIANPLRMADRNEMRQYLEKNVEGYAELRQEYENVDTTYQAQLDAVEAEEERLFDEWEKEHPEAGTDTHAGIDARKEAQEKIEGELGIRTLFDKWNGAENNLSAQMKVLVDQYFRDSEFDGIILEKDEGAGGKKTTQTYIAFDPNQIKSAADNAGMFGAETDNIYFQEAFHGSPYKFNRFNISHMGKGEGAQAFGWGLYFAGKKEIAEYYRKMLKKTAYTYKGEQYVESIEGNDRLYRNSKTGEAVDVLSTLYDVLESLRNNDGDKEYTKERIKSSRLYNDNYKDEYLSILDDVDVDEGQLYEVDIPDDDEMLDWDKPLSEQPEKVKEALETFIRDPSLRKFLGIYNGKIDHNEGKYIYSAIAERFAENDGLTLPEKNKATSQYLNSLNIKGIRYLDGSSRAAGKGSHNYVIFDDSDINITQTFYSEAFRDAGLSEFINNYPEVVKEAARFNSGAEMAEHYADYLAMPDDVYKKARALGYFDALARAAKAGDAENATNAITGVSAEKAAEALAAYGVNAKNALDAAELARKDNWQAAVELLEKQGVPRIDVETYADTAKMFGRSEMLWLERAADAANDTSAKNKKQPSGETVKLGVENAATLKFFDTLVDGAKEIYPDEDIETTRMELAGEPRNAQAFVEMIYTDKGFDDLIKLAYEAQRDGPQRGMDEEETQRNQSLFYRIRNAFNPEGNWNWKTAFAAVAVNRKVDPRTKKILQGMIRNRPLQYMEAWAMLTGDDTWLPGENDIQRIKRLDTEGLVDEEYLEKQSPEELERIGRRLSSERVKKKIDDGTLLLDDPDLNDHEKQLKEDLARAKELIAEREEGFKEYRRMLDLAEMNARKEQMLLEQGAADTSDEGLKKSREQTKKTAEAHKQVRDTIAEMERFMREDLTPTQRAAFLELRRQLKERERINAELKAIVEIREIKKRNLRQILRKPDLKTVSVNEAKLIEWVQAHFDSYQAVARFIGRGAKDIRQLYNDFATSAEYRGTLKRKLPDAAYHQIERIVFKDLAGREVRAYGEIDARQRRVLYKHLIDHQGIFEELGIDILAEPRQFSEAEWVAIREEMKDRIPADVLYKLEGMITKDKNGNRRFRVENLKDSDLQTLAGIVNKLRKEGREREAARRDARTQLWQEGQEKILETLKAHMPKNTAGSRMEGIAETRHKEGKRSGLRDIWFGLHNTRRFFRKLEGGVDGYLYDYITQREYNAFDDENRRVFERREKVEKELKGAKIDIKDLGRHKFTLWNRQEASLEEMMTFYYAQYNERALHAVMFGNFATQEEREAIKQMAKDRDIEGQMNFEAEIAKRYWGDIKKLDVFFAQGENAKYRQVMEIIGRDFDENYSRLKEFAAREFNEELGSEPYYMPLNRVSVTAEEGKDFENAMADAGHSPYINSGFMKGRVDIPSWGQQPIQVGLYSTWDRMVVKQEHLMAYGSLHREMKQIFQGQGSEALRETLKRGYSEAAVKKVKNFISELAAPPVQEDLAAMNAINRVIRGHYPAAVLGWRIASIIKQAIESPPPFLQYVNPIEYGAALAACARKENRDMIYAKSVYMKARYFDPSAAVVREMEKLYLTGELGKAEAALMFVEKKGMWFQEWIDSVCVMPGWLAAYNRKLAELNKSGDNMTMEAAEASAVRYADGVVRDCQPSSVLMDQVPMLKGSKHPFVRMFMQFQTPIASIFQQLFIDAPNNFKQGRILQALWTWGIYALLAIVIGAMHEDDDDDEWDPKKRGIDALVMPLDMVPIFGGDAAYAMESLLRDGKIRTPRRSNFPVVDQGVRAVNAITDEKWGKAAWSVVKGFGFYTGLPVAAMQDIEKAIDDEKWYRVIGIK